MCVCEQSCLRNTIKTNTLVLEGLEDKNGTQKHTGVALMDSYRPAYPSRRQPETIIEKQYRCVSKQRFVQLQKIFLAVNLLVFVHACSKQVSGQHHQHNTTRRCWLLHSTMCTHELQQPFPAGHYWFLHGYVHQLHQIIHRPGTAGFYTRICAPNQQTTFFLVGHCWFLHSATCTNCTK